MATCEDDTCNNRLITDAQRRNKLCLRHSTGLTVTILNVKKRFCQRHRRTHLLKHFEGNKKQCTLDPGEDSDSDDTHETQDSDSYDIQETQVSSDEPDETAQQNMEIDSTFAGSGGTPSNNQIQDFSDGTADDAAHEGNLPMVSQNEHIQGLFNAFRAFTPEPEEGDLIFELGSSRVMQEDVPCIDMSHYYNIRRVIRRGNHEGVPIEEITLIQPDDWHLHLGKGNLLCSILPLSASQFGLAMVMPNLESPITTTDKALAYRNEIMNALHFNYPFSPLMTLCLMDNMNPDEIKLARKSGVIFGVKLCLDSVTDIGKCSHIFEQLTQYGMPLLVHGEVTDPNVDIYDREKIFIEKILAPLSRQFPDLKIVMEHITTLDAVNFIDSCNSGNIAATVMPQHMLKNRNALLEGWSLPHNFCLPILKREHHRQAIVNAVTSGSKKYFLGTNSAPHDKTRKESSSCCANIFSVPIALSLYATAFDQVGALDKLEAFASFNGPDFYGLPRNGRKIKLRKSPWLVPDSYGDVVPMFAGELVEWEVCNI